MLSGESDQFDFRSDIILLPDFKVNALPFRGLEDFSVGFEDHVGVVVDFTKMGKNYSSELLMVKGFEKLTGIDVGQVTVAASDALLELPWIGTV